MERQALRKANPHLPQIKDEAAQKPKSATPFGLRVVPIFPHKISLLPSGIVERAKRERAWKSPLRLAFLVWDYFHARSRFARSLGYPWEKKGTTGSLFSHLWLFGGDGVGGITKFPISSAQDCSQPRSQGSLLYVPTEGRSRRENLGTRLDYSLVEFNR